MRLGGAKPGVVYPNSGEVWHADSRRWSGAGSEIAAHAQEWIADGARLVGGCCRVGPDQIAEIAHAVARLRGLHDRNAFAAPTAAFDAAQTRHVAFGMKRPGAALPVHGASHSSSPTIATGRCNC